ncbi:MAG: xanthine dehydrogenase family protein molybdopterin-binding subunit [Betaproteobacteria bacterium]|nr:xanthine dehydrogenase family protein molybdopterin-binding subunit [Betaproteobacteria bacterium]
MTAATFPQPIGASLARPRARRILEGRGRYTDDIVLPRMVHAAFVRSPHPHARLISVDSAAAQSIPGVIRIVTGKELAEHTQSYSGVHQLFVGMRAPQQWPMVVDVARFQGEPVVAVIADTRAHAEDAAETIAVEWEALDAVSDGRIGMTNAAPVIHGELGTNIAYQGTVASGDIDAALSGAAAVLEQDFRFGRHTGVCLEPRSIIADYQAADQALTVYQSHQSPSQQQDIYARLMGLDEHKVRVSCPDVGGAFGIKQQLYGDELATCILSKLVNRPVKFIADRIESMSSDIHARDHSVHARLAVDAHGRFIGLDVDDCFGIGAYSQYPRSSIGEGSHLLRLSGAAYALDAYRSQTTMVLQNKSLIGHYRSVGHPIAVAVTESLVDQAARRLRVDPLDIRRRNYIPESAYPHQSHGGFVFDQLSQHACLEKFAALIEYDKRRAEQTALRKAGVYRGIGIASFVELSGTGPEYYGKGGAPVSAQDGVMLKLEPSGKVRCFPSVSDQGQGTDNAIGQVVAAIFGVSFDDVTVISGDSEGAPYGGGAWASRGAAMGGEAAYRAAEALRDNVLLIAASVLQAKTTDLALREGGIVNAADGQQRMSIAEVARIGYFRQDLLPPDLQPELSVVRHYVPRGRPFVISNGIQGSYVEVDIETGFVTLLDHVVVHDGGTMINPMLVEEQIRGGVVQGIGAALYEEILYGDAGELTTGTMADYLVPMSFEMPDIRVDHVSTPLSGSALGAKGVGEAGTAGSSAAVLNAVNDALSPFDALLSQIPMTPERILRALGRVS